MKQSVENRRAIVNAAGTQAVNVQSFLKIVKKYTKPIDLTLAILREFVEKVVVHTPDKSSGHWVQRIDVHYAFIGEIDLSPEYSKLSTGKRPLHDDLASCGGFMQEINHIIVITGCGTRCKVNFNTVRLLLRFHSPYLTRSGR